MDLKLFDGQSADGNSVEFEITRAGPVNLFVGGDFGGGTATVQFRNPDGSWIPISGGAFTATEMRVIDTAPGRGRLALSGSTSPDLDAWVSGGTWERSNQGGAVRPVT